MRKEKELELNSYIEELKTIKKELVSNSSNFITVEKYNCLLNNHKAISREKIIKNKSDGSAAIVLPITVDGTIIVTVQPRVFTHSSVGIGLPAGYVENGEEHINAAIRELREETGYVADKLSLECAFYQDDGCSGAYNKGFVAFNCKKVGKQKLDKDEFIRYFECLPSELLELVDKGLINDAGSQLLIEKSKKYFK
jgi:ADP-ribose pyrophosphatase